MDRSAADRDFAGSIPQLYDRYLGPLLFAPYAADLARRVAQQQPARVLELAAGAGVLTRQLAQILPPSVDLVATDLNQPMLAHAAAVGTPRPVRWQQADALALPSRFLARLPHGYRAPRQEQETRTAGWPSALFCEVELAGHCPCRLVAPWRRS